MAVRVVNVRFYLSEVFVQNAYIHITDDDLADEEISTQICNQLLREPWLCIKDVTGKVLNTINTSAIQCFEILGKGEENAVENSSSAQR